MQQPRERDRIQCLECRRWYRALPTHLLRGHNMDDEDYRLKYGIPAGTPLVCVEWSERQSQLCIERDSKRMLTPGGLAAGFSQRESVRRLRRDAYRRLAAIGKEAAAQLDKTAARRELLQPYPVTVAQAADRLACSKSAAYTFLSYCVLSGRLWRVGRGLYDEITK